MFGIWWNPTLPHAFNGLRGLHKMFPQFAHLVLSSYIISRKTQGSLRRKRKSVSGGSNRKRTLIVTSLYWAQYITSSSNRNRFSEKLKLKFYTILVFSAKIANLAICGAHTVYQNGLSVELLHLGLKIN